MKINIFFDLDGTLIDASERLYKLFIDLIPDCKLTKQEYWSLKRQNIKHKTIIENLVIKKHFTRILESFKKKYNGILV